MTDLGPNGAQLREHQLNESCKVKKNPEHKIETKLAQLGRDPNSHEGFVNPPIQRGSTVLFDNPADLYRKDIKTYGLEGASTQDRLCSALTEIMGGVGTILCPSGLSAITLVLLGLTKSGDHVLVCDSAYGPTRRFCDEVLAKYGVETTYYPPSVGTEIGAFIKPNTVLIMLESPGSITMELQDIPAIVKVAKAKGIVTAIDDTWSAGVYFKPLAIGVDISIQALTKYQSGHSDVLAGSVTTNNEELLARLLDMHLALGIGTSAEDAWLCLRGLRTMAVRLAHQDQTARKIASWLETREEVERVLHPALPSSPDNAIWQRDFTGAGGLFSFILKPVGKAKIYAMLEAFEIFAMGFSWGGYESLVLYCDPQIKRSAVKWTENGHLIRLAIGLENVDDLIADLDRALEALK
ncbi:MAG: cystathionine beta-lyase [Hyphomonadaceae bacterium]|nr:MAG: cystathionine beta-lyase [Hyphomonadaceae bacterium]KAF0186113.1 MAG: cystathionine beta-lyase [Hyphomonadaceae bacterium]